MAGYGIYSYQITRYEKLPDGSMLIVDSWFECGNSHKSHHPVRCEHRHNSYEEASECIPAMENLYRTKRWPKPEEPTDAQ